MTTTQSAAASRYLTTARRGLTAALTGVAFWNSYSHTAQWFEDNGQASQAHALAAIPEAAIILVLLTLAQGGMNKITQWIIAAIGVGSVAITLTANLEAAGPGAMGVAAALVAPIFAILGFGLEIASLTAPAAAKPTAKRKTSAPTAARKQAWSKRAGHSLTDTGILWATRRASVTTAWPTTTQIMEQFPQISRTTAQKIRNADPAKVTI